MVNGLQVKEKRRRDAIICLAYLPNFPSSPHVPTFVFYEMLYFELWTSVASTKQVLNSFVFLMGDELCEVVVYEFVLLMHRNEKRIHFFIRKWAKCYYGASHETAQKGRKVTKKSSDDHTLTYLRTYYVYVLAVVLGQAADAELSFLVEKVDLAKVHVISSPTK